METIALLLISLLLYGAVLLIQLMLRLMRGRTTPMQYRRTSAPPVLSSFMPSAPPPVDQPSMPPAAVPRPRADVRAPRRFSRARLLGNRSAVQDAIVLAAILEPCHAHRRRQDSSEI